MPRSATVPAALVLAGLETAVALSLLTETEVRFGILTSAVLLGFFTGLAVHNARREDPLPCYCFGTHETDTSPRLNLTRLGALNAVAALLVGRWISSGWGRVADPISLAPVLLAVAALILGIWLLHAPSIAKLHQIPSPRASCLDVDGVSP